MTENAAKFIINRFMVSEGKPVVTRTLAGEYEVADINVSLLKAIAERWKARNFEERVEGVSSYDSNPPTLFLCVSVGQVYEGATPLLRVRNAKKDLSRFERFLAKRAFKFKRASVDSKNNGGDMIESLSEQVVQAIRNDAPSDYEGIHNQLLATHKDMLSVGETKDENGNPSNFAELYAGWQSYATHWVRSYNSQFKAATDGLASNSEYFEDCCYFAHHICNHVLWRTESYVGLVDALKMQASLDYYLDAWWNNACDRHNITHGIYAPTKANPTDATNHKNALKCVIEGWEGVLKRSLDMKADAVKDWKQLGRLFEGFEAHLNESITNLARAVVSGNEVAADLWLEHLHIWPERSSAIQGMLESSLTDSQLMLCNSDRLSEDWETARRKIIADDTVALVLQELTPQNLFDVIKDNLWHDGRMVLCAFLLQWATASNEKEESRDNSLIIRTLRGMLESRGSARSIYLGFLRSNLRNVWDRESYPSKLENIGHRIIELSEEEKVTGRVYTVAIPAPLEHIRHQILRLALAHGDVASMPNDLDDILADKDTASRFSHVLTQCSENLTENPNVEHLKMLNPDNTEVQLKDKYEQLRVTTKNLLSIISVSRDKAIQSAPINENALAAIVQSVSETIFNPEDGHFPLNQFTNFVQVASDDGLEPFTLNHAGFPKSAIIQEPTVNFPIDLHQDAVRQYVSAWLMVDVLSAAMKRDGFQKIEYTSDTELISEFLNVTADIADEDIFIVAEFKGSQDILFDWRKRFSPYFSEETDHASGIEVSRDETFKDDRNYLFSVNSIPAFRVNAKLDGLLIVPKSLLAELTLRTFENNFPIQINFAEDETDPWHGTLSFHWERKVELSDDDNLKLYQFTQTNGEGS